MIPISNKPIENKPVDLNVRSYGFQKCEPNHSYGPAVRDYYLFHYIFSGQGLYQVDGRTYNLSEGQGFLIFPKQLTYYNADSENPWVYAWLGFSGLMADEYVRASGFDRKNPIWYGKKDDFICDCLLKMCDIHLKNPASRVKLIGYASLFLSRMMETASKNTLNSNITNSQEYYVKAAIEYMEHFYQDRLTVNDIANYVGLNRSYLGSIFNKHLKMSMQEFLISLRMRKACELLNYHDISVGDVARSVGYQDQFHFSKLFKRVMGMSPLNYRKQMEAENQVCSVNFK